MFLIFLIFQCVRTHLLLPLLAQVKNAASDKTTVTLAMFLFLLVQKWRIDLEPDNKNTLFKAMLVKPDSSRKECPDLSNLQFHFSGQMEKKQYDFNLKIFDSILITLY